MSDQRKNWWCCKANYGEHEPTCENHQPERRCVMGERLEQDYGLSPAQFHAGLNKLWAAMPQYQGVQNDDVFTLAAARIAKLEAEVKRLLDAIDDIEVQTAYNDSDDSVGYCVGCGEPLGCSDTCIFEIRKQFRAKYD